MGRPVEGERTSWALGWSRKQAPMLGMSLDSNRFRRLGGKRVAVNRTRGGAGFSKRCFPAFGFRVAGWGKVK